MRLIYDLKGKYARYHEGNITGINSKEKDETTRKDPL